jgi:hypothetical protein
MKAASASNVAAVKVRFMVFLSLIASLEIRRIIEAAGVKFDWNIAQTEATELAALAQKRAFRRRSQAVVIPNAPQDALTSRRDATIVMTKR